MSMDNLRKEIDRIDDEILELFKRRMSIAEDLVKHKIEHNLPVFNPQSGDHPKSKPNFSLMVTLCSLPSHHSYASSLVK